MDQDELQKYKADRRKRAGELRRIRHLAVAIFTLSGTATLLAAAQVSSIGLLLPALLLLATTGHALLLASLIKASRLATSERLHLMGDDSDR